MKFFSILCIELKTRHGNEQNASNVDNENNIDQVDITSDAGSIIRYTRDGSQDLSVDSPLPCRSADSSSDGVFFSSTQRTKVLDNNRRFISKSQMKGKFKTKSKAHLYLFFFFFCRTEFREAFRLFDKDGDGCITKEGNRNST